MIVDPNTIKEAVAQQSAPSEFPPMGDQNPSQGGNVMPAEPDQNSILTNVDRRLRMLEERFINLRRRTQVADQNMLKTKKDISKELKAGSEEIKEVRMQINDIKEKFRIFVNELRGYATREDFKVLEKYVNLWEPIRFVSRNEVEHLIKESVEQRFSDLNIRIQQEKFIEQEVGKTFARMKSTGQLK